VQVFSSLSVIVKLGLVCLILGFVLGLCAAGASWFPSGGMTNPPTPASEAPTDTPATSRR
jgi:hypothetical protein